MKAVVLARVSTKEQEEGLSIAAQKQRLHKYCEHKSLEVLQTYEIVESSTRGDRKEFIQMVKFAATYPETVAIVADKIDRIQRNYDQFPWLDKLIRQGKIQIHTSSENSILHQEMSAAEWFNWAMRVALAQNYSNSISDNVKRSFMYKLNRGEWPGRSPIGYLNQRTADNKSNIVLDPARGPIIRNIFEMYATGAYSVRQLTEYAKQQGLVNKDFSRKALAYSYVDRLLTNPFYYGQMKLKGALIEHKYERLISKSLFDQCLSVRKGYNKKPVKLCKRTDSPLQGILRCEVTGRLATPDVKTKKNGKGTLVYNYMAVNKPERPQSKMYVNETHILKQICEVLKSIVIPQKEYDAILATLKSTSVSEREFHQEALASSRDEESAIQRKLDKLMELFLAEQVAADDYKRTHALLKNRQFELNERIKNFHKADDAFRYTLVNIMQLVQNMEKTFESSNTQEKKEILSLLFSNLALHGASLRFTLNKPFTEWLNCAKSNKWLPLVETVRTKYYQIVVDLATASKRFFGQLP